MPLTDIEVRKAKAGEKEYLLGDGGGLNLLVRPLRDGKTSKTWILRHWVDGKEKKETLGKYPAMSLADARNKRDEIKLAMQRGGTPDDVLRPVEAPTFEKLAREWQAKEALNWTPKYAMQTNKRMEVYLLPKLGHRFIKDITASELLNVLRPISEAGKYEMLSKVRQIFSGVARYGIACGVCDVDVSMSLRGALPSPKSKPMAALTSVEDVRRLVRAIDGYRAGITKGALWWHLLTLARPGEVRKAEWAEINLDSALWALPPEKMKMRRAHVVPLCSQALSILEQLRPLTGRGQYVFPSLRSSTGTVPMSENTVLYALRDMGFGPDEMVAHGFRALGSTRLNEMGFREDVIEIALAHARKGVKSAYNRALYLDERRDMMQAWGDWLDGLRESQEPIRILV